MCERTVEKVPRVPKHIPDYFKTPEMCNKAVEVDPWQLKYVPKDLITRGMCNRVVDDCSWELEHVPNQHKTRGMCNWAVSRHDVCLLQYVPDWFEGVIQEKIKICLPQGILMMIALMSGMKARKEGRQRKKI